MAGRRPRQYAMPDNGALYRLLNARPSGSDPLQAEDLRSPSDYRQALQRGLFARRPGRYSRQWLARRLGISVWTSRRYDREIGVLVDATYQQQGVFWGNIEHCGLKSEVSRPEGVYLETPEGKRYPPLLALARRLLARHEGLMLKRQHWNYYRLEGAAPPLQTLAPVSIVSEEIHNNMSCIEQMIYSDGPDMAGVAAHDDEGSASERVEEKRSFWLCPDCMRWSLGETRPGACEGCGGCAWEAVPAAIWQDTQAIKAWWRLRYRSAQRGKPQSESASDPRQEQLAQRLYDAVRQRNARQSLTMSTARRLVGEYGVEAVERALALLKARRNLRNAAGFIVTVLRSEGQGCSRPKARPADSTTHAEWLARLHASPYLDFYDNVGEVG